jgi:hypothetical protein
MKPFNIGVLGIGDISDVYISNLKTYDIVSVVGCRDAISRRRGARLSCTGYQKPTRRRPS